MIKISDIARMAGVSPSTVARVIHNNGYVSLSNRKIIEEVIEKYHYVPNRAAQGLKNKNTKIIGHVVPDDQTNHVFSLITGAIKKAAEESGYHIITVSNVKSKEHEEHMVEELLSRMVDGLIFTSSCSPELVREVVKREIPVVMIERPHDIENIEKVLIDNHRGSYLAVKHLIDHNHRNIGYIGKDIGSRVEEERLDGFVTACKESGIITDQSDICLVEDYTSEDGYAAALKLMKNETDLTALFISSDILAAGVMQYLYEQGIKVPDDISIVGYDDTLSRFMAPGLTTVALPFEEIGKTAMKALMDVIENKESGHEFRLTPYMVERDSVRKIQIFGGQNENTGI
ncbi:MAG: LacI family DNA-binding transcriptional regulator [Clostridia bacterium]|nr:LacI family DNA-binding transcriptional regulator [Clostridia bacterium]